jgi:type II secretory pathway pseudopilin PulG
MGHRNEQGMPPGPPEGALPGEAEAPGARRERMRTERKRRKVSLIAALVVNVVTVIVVAIVIVAILLPGYRRSFTAAKAVKGADEVWIVVRTSEASMRENETDFIRAQDGLRNSLQELVESGGNNVYAYVRDGYPDQSWVESNLPEDMRKWLEGLFPAPESKPEGTEGTDSQDGGTGTGAGKDSQEVRP